MADIFVCYRRKDSAGHAGRLVRDLSAQFPGSKIFHDMDSLHAGVSFRNAISKALNSSSVFLAVVGPHWKSSIHRLENPEDLVRIEIQTALNRDTVVIPVLVGGATLPTRDELPEAIAGLVDRQVHEITDKRWDYDVRELAADLGELPGLRGLFGLRSVYRRIRRSLAAASAWLYIPVALVAMLLVLATITHFATGRELVGPPPGLRPLDVNLMQENVPEVDANCVMPLNCESMSSSGEKPSQDIRLLSAHLSVDVEHKELHVLLGVSWTLREGNTNLVHRGYTGKIYYVAPYQRDLIGDKVLVSGMDYRGDSLAPYNGLIAYTFGWIEVRILRGRQDVLTRVIESRINEAPEIQALP
jgi:hypothetical protein